ncbi:MAG: ABC transporter substrate-binding protein [Azoarcus sp.]|nr:MAG: ABC transporter substrate-binding protein [Betaproteobacteria bacterium HGW-Betaproteobacteria-21]PLX73393.1 MAG: ABC transporter substrate-binding protein [Azoarcus sp.]TVT56516.1 MAG: ABC transporter substrate-binding protein [Azoarcus sp. PHD]
MMSFLRAGLALFALLCLTAAPVRAAELPVLRVGVLQFGTVSWELAVMQKGGFAEREGVRIEVVPLALKDAANIAMLGSAVDVVVNDWIWVARQRAEGQDFTFVPYSLAVGGVMVRPDAGVKAFADLKGKRLGVAGGPLDKSWLLLRAYARRTVGADTAGWLEPAFVAPPLLNELMLRGELPAAMNFWHYGARLQAAGMVPLLSMDEILRTLDVDAELPLVGWVFREQWAAQHPQAIRSFLRASAATKQHMLESDAVWDELRPMMKVTDDATFVALREGFRAGIPAATMGESEQVARKVFAILAAEGGPALVGKATSLASGTFWAGGLER